MSTEIPKYQKGDAVVCHKVSGANSTHKVSGANKNSINLMKRVALKDMRDVRELLFENSWKEKTLKRFLEYCYMIDVKVALEGLNGEKTRGLKAAVKYVKEHDIGMTAHIGSNAI